jgi:predicted phosphohydrolase
MLFQYVSDIHLEISKKLPTIKPVAPYLILAGDIGYPTDILYKDFLEMVSKLFEHIFLISGNHEYYSKDYTMNEIDTIILKICNSYPNIHYLNNTIYEFNNICIFGSTFWSYIKPDEESFIRMMISDYRCIPDFTPQTSNELYKTAINKLQTILDYYPNVIVISHHIPKNELVVEKYKSSPFNSAFASDIVLADHPNIKAWVYGHTHVPSINGNFYSNPIGYPGENNKLDYEKVFSVII